MEDLIIHIYCSDIEAYQELEKLCKEFTPYMFIDCEGSWDSWVKEREQINNVNEPERTTMGAFEAINEISKILKKRGFEIK